MVVQNSFFCHIKLKSVCQQKKEKEKTNFQKEEF